MVDCIVALALALDHFETEDFHLSKPKLLSLKKYYHRCYTLSLLFSVLHVPRL